MARNDLKGSLRGGIGVIVKYDHTRQVTSATLRALSKAVEETAKGVKARAQANVVNHGLVDTGFLLNSIQDKMTGEHEAEINVGAEYGVYHEYGTRHIPARPFMFPALLEERAAFIARLKKAGVTASATASARTEL